MIWWVLTLLYNQRAWTTLYTLAWTNRDAHLFMAWANYKPARHKVYKNVRGVRLHCGYRWIWDTPHIAEQNESGDTYSHTFNLVTLAPTDHVWYYLFSLTPDLTTQCQGPLIHIEPPEVPMPSARIFHSVPQPIPSHAIAILLFDSALWDDGGFYDPATPDRLTVPTDGLYAIGCSFRYETTLPAGISARIKLGPFDEVVQHSHYVNGNNWPGTAFSMQTIMALRTGDFLQVETYHTSGAPRNIVIRDFSSPHFWIAYLGPYPT